MHIVFSDIVRYTLFIMNHLLFEFSAKLADGRTVWVYVCDAEVVKPAQPNESYGVKNLKIKVFDEEELSEDQLPNDWDRLESMAIDKLYEFYEWRFV